MEQKENSRTGLYGFFFIALVLLIFATYFMYSNRSLKTSNQNLTKENQALSEEMADLEILRDDLFEDVERLQLDYDELIESNDSLGILFSSVTNEVTVKKAEINKIKKDFAKDAAGIKKEVEQLRGIKKELTILVNNLKLENEQLKKSNQQLTEKVGAVEAAKCASRYLLLASLLSRWKGGQQSKTKS